MNTVSKETISDFKKLGIYQIAGGVIGLVRLSVQVFTISNYKSFTIIFYLLFFVMFFYSCFAGWLCIKKDFKNDAITHSLINQWIQVPGISIAGNIYYYAAGISLYAGFNFTTGFNLQFDFSLSNIFIYLNSNFTTISFIINLVAVFAIYWINKLKKQVKLETDLTEVRSIGEGLPN